MLRSLFRFLLAALFLAIGTFHLCDPRFFLPIMPPAVPFPLACVVISGVAEMLGGIGLLLAGGRLRRFTGWWLVALLLAVFPANVYMAVAHVKIHGWPAHDWEAWARLPVQAVLIGLVVWVTRTWPGYCEKEVTMQLKPPRP